MVIQSRIKSFVKHRLFRIQVKKKVQLISVPMGQEMISVGQNQRGQKILCS